MEIYLILVTALLFIAGFYLLWRKMGRADGQASDSEALRIQADRLAAEKSALEERSRLLQAQVDQLNRLNVEKDASILQLNRDLTASHAGNEALRGKLEEQLADLEKLQEKFRIEFRNLANEILEEKTHKFTEQNRVKLDEILQPLGEKIRAFEKKVEETYDKESKQRFSLEKEIRNLTDLNQQISKEANNLTSALKGQAKARGNWGEIILESILEKSGLVRDREFFVQPSFTGEQGKRLQPDVVVHYPGGRHVVIDSKVSLIAYERYASAETREEQEAALKEHLASVRNHIADLSGKNYQDIYDLKSLDFVMLFMPIEPAYMLAMQYDPNLWNWAYDRRILVISPTNLIAALRMIANLWRVEYQNKNAMEIARQGGELYDKFVGFAEDLQEIGNRLDATRKAYDASMNKLNTGKGNLVRRVENIRALGAKTSKEIPRSMLEGAEEEQ
ncbi:MAG TPA: DNA recombination protein RmuC [Bacteroidales bacterium]|nr:DNA recombination protein RmuC [Bacteroidales bacterium]HPS63404.1 DNA recombination protein RmuC [Bacteroidales bacterium]